jgi:undecaprenyl diphosphate synthase
MNSPSHPSEEQRAQTLLGQLDSSRIPRHIAIIMDGNGRWAKKENMARIEGHRQGAETVRRIAQTCRKLGVQALTLYAFSDENWQRPKTEIAQLMELLAKFLVQERNELRDNQIRLQVIGTIDRLPGFVKKVLNETLDFTARDHEMTLNLALSYGARNEILRGVKRILTKVEKGELKIKDIDEEVFGQHLDTAGLPDPELMIRTSGEMRISNFLLWQLAYTEIHVTPILWPDFQASHLYEAILDFQSRERRFGLTSEQVKKRC